MSRAVRIAFVSAAVIFTATFSSSLFAQRPDRSNGQAIFRFDTFGDEQLWTDVLRMHEVIATVSPRTALSVGLKVDVEALPASIVDALRNGQVNLDDPAVTLELLRLNAVVGIIGRIDDTGRLVSVGTTCALCHSTVDNSLASGIGHRLDGWPNRTLNAGVILGLSPALAAFKDEFAAWGPGKYDPRHHAFDGTGVRLLNEPSEPVLIPPAYGLQGVGFETYTGDGPISYWNSYVGISQMGGQGTFSDPRIGLTITQKPDRIMSKLPALRDYQLGLLAPPAPAGSFDAAAARRGERVFHGKAGCATCHIPPTYTDVSSGPNPNVPVLHDATAVGSDPVYASRSATKQYRATPLRGAWQHPPYFHDGSAATFLAVVYHYDELFRLNLSQQQKADLVEFLKSL